jgi:hypothetical protein
VALLLNKAPPLLMPVPLSVSALVPVMVVPAKIECRAAAHRHRAAVPSAKAVALPTLSVPADTVVPPP